MNHWTSTQKTFFPFSLSSQEDQNSNRFQKITKNIHQTLTFQNDKLNQIVVNFVKFSEIQNWIFIIELKSLQFQHEFVTKLTNSYDHSEKWEEERIEASSEPVKKKEKRITDLFSVPDLPEACVDLFVRISESKSGKHMKPSHFPP